MNEKKENLKITQELDKIFNDKDSKNQFKKLIDLEKKYPNDIAILQLISRNYLATGENTKALDYLLKAKSLNPDNFSIYYNLGTLYQSFKKDDDAIECFKKSIDLNKDFLNGYNMLGDIFFKKKKHKEAIIYFKNSIKIDYSIRNINAISLLALSILGNYFETKNLIELKDALIYFKKAHELDPSNDIFSNQLIYFYHLVGMKNEAVYLSKKRTGFFEI
jgi:tetratricopeptide (TPR) repeat protein|tara:strand:- start:786 stop:1442 length:657 start_codon:yes stop_codon:yes gene_type:complete